MSESWFLNCILIILPRAAPNAKHVSFCEKLNMNRYIMFMCKYIHDKAFIFLLIFHFISNLFHGYYYFTLFHFMHRCHKCDAFKHRYRSRFETCIHQRICLSIIHKFIKSFKRASKDRP